MARISILVGSVYGGAEFTAEQVCQALRDHGHQVAVSEAQSAQELLAEGSDAWLVITSTTGCGDLPDNLFPLFLSLKEQFPLLPKLRYGVIALGDSSYGETFCGAGRQFDELLAELTAVRVGERLQIDACETMEPEQVALPWVVSWQVQLSEALAEA
ncbi:flavodoxin [Ferrimonas sediminicola]|uniref:Flavodoxin n=1 Tax=Ferrimonas sediminicola TaxID=2569538 RepID=A0A4U1BF54_9GAMM|nr:flavodoxin [Ferrimonas sediminicola]TKB49737.1 flavodoxin [Ferrimonas sediminicola]